MEAKTTWHDDELAKALDQLFKRDKYYLYSSSPNVFHTKGVNDEIRDMDATWFMTMVSYFGSEMMLTAMAKDVRLQKKQTWDFL